MLYYFHAINYVKISGGGGGQGELPPLDEKLINMVFMISVDVSRYTEAVLTTKNDN